MEFSRLRVHRSTARPKTVKLSKLLIPLAALTLCQSVFGANLLQTTTPTLTLSCSTVSGLGSNATVTIKPVTALTGINTLAVTLNAAPTGGVVVTPSSGTLTAGNSATGIVFNVNLANGCVGVTTGAPTFRFAAGGTADITVTVNTTLTATTSGLNPPPSSFALTCVKSGGVWTPGPSQTVNITSAAVGGTPFTVDNSG